MSNSDSHIDVGGWKLEGWKASALLVAIWMAPAVLVALAAISIIRTSCG